MASASSPPSTPQHARTASASMSASSPSAASSGGGPQNTAFNPSGLPASAFAAPSATAYPGGPAQWGARMSGFSWSLLHPHLPDGDVVDRWMDELGEQFIMKADMQIATGDGSAMEVKNRTVVLTESNWIEMKMAEGPDPPALPNPSSCALLSKELGTKAQKQKKHKPLIEIHSVEIEPVVAGAPYPYAFRICFFSGSAASIAKAGFGKLKRVFSISSDFDSFLKSKVVRCHSAEECNQWVTVFHCLLRNTWQSKIEREILPEPEIYKRHAFVIKQHNDRLVLLSDFWFYNVEVTYKPVVIKTIKWAIPVSSINMVAQVNAKDGLAVMRLTFDADEARKQWDVHHRSKEKGELRGDKKHEFQFRSATERQRFVNSIEAVFWQTARKRLNISTVDK